jgi:hypothetical protein
MDNKNSQIDNLIRSPLFAFAVTVPAILTGAVLIFILGMAGVKKSLALFEYHQGVISFLWFTLNVLMISGGITLAFVSQLIGVNNIINKIRYKIPLLGDFDLKAYILDTEVNSLPSGEK